MERWFVVVNPLAASGRAESMWKDISSLLAQYGIPYEVFVIDSTSYAAPHVACAIEQGYRKFIAVGGDGTIHQVLKGFKSARAVTGDVILGVIPAGSGNDWIRMYGIPKDAESAVRLIAAGHTIRQDIGKITFGDEGNSDYMMNVAGVGLDACVCDRVNRMKALGKKGKLIYVNGLLSAFADYRCSEVRVVCDGKTVFEGKMLSMSVGNGRYSGGGMMQTPDACPDDGLLDVSIIPALPLWKIAIKAHNLFNGKLSSVREVVSCRCRSLLVESSVTLPVEVDGEAAGTTPLVFDVEPGAINIIVP